MAPAADLPSDVAIRLADEGVPVRAIARAVHMPAELLRPHFERAKLVGRLVDLPREDWPPGVPRAHRVPDLQPIADVDEEVLKAWIMQAFAMTAGQARMFLALIRRREVHRDQLHSIYNERDGGVADTEVKIVDVQICMMRKLLKDKGIEIRTLWSFGYCMTTANRRCALELLLAGLGRTEMALEDEIKNAPEEAHGR
jgi:DNA-binding winged helix-turn-helix (wHTH) protein